MAPLLQLAVQPPFGPILQLTVLLLLQGLGSIRADGDYLETCCSLGSYWGGQNLRCEKFAVPVTWVPQNNQPACLEAVEICCRKALEEQDCARGKADAKAGGACIHHEDRLKSASGADYRRDCCEGCKLGLLTGSSGENCESKKMNLGVSWNPAFMECCKEVTTGTTLDSSSTTPTEHMPLLTSASITEIKKLETDLQGVTDRDTSNTFKSHDLCQLLKGLLCSEICISTPGSYYCKCHEGSILQEDGRSCESSVTTVEPPSLDTTLSLVLSSQNTSSHIKNSTMFFSEANTISPFDGNSTNLKIAPVGARSKNLIVPILTFKMFTIPAKSRSTRSLVTEDNELNLPCPAGYRYTPSTDTCDDLNECTELTNICPNSDTICVNTPGSFECKSLEEYMQTNKTNVTGNGSEDTRSGDYEGLNEGGSQFTCAFGMKYNLELKRCDDIDECEMQQQPCAPGELCRNTVGGYDCIPAGCPRGFILAGELCQDVDECEQGLHSCALHERCQNTNGSFTCELPRSTRRPPTTEPSSLLCRKGYKANNETGACVDIDECMEGPGCRDHERCRNLEGSYDCLPLCDSGWYFQLQTKTCQDVDECLLGHHNCRQRTQICRNTEGSYSCEARTACPSGYRRSQEGGCADVDECAEGLHQCSPESHRYCVNREGGYECITRLPSCPRGFQYSLFTRQCEDVDECRGGLAACDAAAGERCLNLPGAYRCERPRSRPELRAVKRPACPAGHTYDAGLRRCSGKGPATTDPTDSAGPHRPE